jgi:hypothetical protein
LNKWGGARGVMPPHSISHAVNPWLFYFKDDVTVILFIGVSCMNVIIVSRTNAEKAE